MLKRVSIAGYRSVGDFMFEPGPLAVLVGPNGCGKTNVYRALGLLAHAAAGRLSRSLAEEGGLPAALSASEAAPAKEIVLRCWLDEWDYELVIGPPPVGESAFRLDPYIRRESLRLTRAGEAPVEFLHRKGVRTVVLDADGRRVDLPYEMQRNEAAISQLRDPARFPELASLRSELLGWRFYHEFRTDSGSPLRRAQVGVFTPALSHDGADLAAALESIREQASDNSGKPSIGSWFERAFPGSSLVVSESDAVFEVTVETSGVRRALRAADLSDGTLRFLCLLAALQAPRPPELLIFNEPESSLHVELLPVLADLIADAATRSQVILTTHARELAEALTATSGRPALELELRRGETRVVGRGRYE